MIIGQVLSWTVKSKRPIALLFTHFLKVPKVFWRQVGPGVIFTYDIQMKVPIAGVSMLFTERRYLAVQGRHGNLNLPASIFSYCKISSKIAPEISYLIKIIRPMIVTNIVHSAKK